MSLRTVAEKYAVDTHRTKAVWASTALLVVVFGFAGWTQAYSYDGSVQPLAASNVQVSAGVLVPLIAVALGHGTIAGARESGELRVLLAYPHSRRDVVVGAFLGRLLPVLGAVGAALLAAVAAYVARSGTLPGSDFLVLAGFVLLWTVFAVSLAVGISALVPTGRRAVAAGIGAYLVFFFGWDWLPTEIVRRTYPREQWYPSPEWAQVLGNLDPISGFMDATRLLLYTPRDPLAFYEMIPFLAGVLVAWTVLPMTLALWQFPKSDL